MMKLKMKMMVMLVLKKRNLIHCDSTKDIGVTTKTGHGPWPRKKKQEPTTAYTRNMDWFFVRKTNTLTGSGDRDKATDTIVDALGTRKKYPMDMALANGSLELPIFRVSGGFRVVMMTVMMMMMMMTVMMISAYLDHPALVSQSYFFNPKP
jgi:hypothetical protein